MLASERRNKMMELIKTQGSLRVAEAAKMFCVTKETIRKDLVLLSDSGLIEKHYGGALPVTETVERPVDARSLENQEDKLNVAKKAVEYIEGNVIFIDSGSTPFLFAQSIPMPSPISIITNSFKVADSLMHSAESLHFIGGEISPITGSTSGFWATSAIKTLSIDVAFMGTSGFQSHTGPCVKSFSEAEIKMDILKKSAKTIVLADSSKFATNAVVQYADWEDVDVLITDKKAPADVVKKLRKTLEVVVA